MKRALLLMTALVICSSAFCITISLHMSFEDTTRNFWVHFPPGFNNAQHLPVVINMHGSGSTGAEEEFYSRMSETSDSNKFIVVYPDGINKVWNSGFTPPYNSAPDDVGFIGKIIDTLYTLYNIDLSRVYSTGMSNGGFQSYRLACDLENRIAAIASVAGALTDLQVINCVLSRHIPVMEIHGTADPLVPYGGETGIKSVEETIDFFTNADQCHNGNDTTVWPNLDPNDSSTVARIRYANCGSGTEVVLFKIYGGGHTWPNAYYPYIYGPTNHDLDASQEIWNFFKRYTINGPSVVEEVKSEMNVSVYPNPGNGNYQLSISNYQFEQPLVSIVYDVTGKKVFEQKVLAPAVELNLTGVESGIYLMHLSGKDISVTKRIVKE